MDIDERDDRLARRRHAHLPSHAGGRTRKAPRGWANG